MSPTLTTANINNENAQQILPMLRLAFDASRDNKAVTESNLNEDTVPALLKAVAYADNDFRAEIENVLVQLGPTVAPVMLDALVNNNNAQVASVAAMVLIRIGQPVESEILNVYRQNQNTAYQWRFDFLMTQLRLNLPALAV